MPPSPVPLAPLVVFVATYAGLAAGRIPGLALDRTGIAVLGAVAMVAVGGVDLAAAKDAQDVPTLAILFGLMLLSVQYRVAGLYSAIGRRVAAIARPRALLAGVIVVAAGLSAVLTNDVVCFALAPLLAAHLRRSPHDPVPFLIALACATNIGSALTPIGNPQNILIAQRLGLGFGPFVLACAAPVALTLALCFWWCARGLRPQAPAAGPEPDPVPFDRWQAGKAIALTVVALVGLCTPAPAWIVALAVGGVVLASRTLRTHEAMRLVDWPLLVLFVALFVVVRGLEDAGWARAAAGALRDGGADLAAPGVLVPASALLSTAVSNVPAVMLMLPFAPPGAGGAPPAAFGHTLALASTFAGNLWLLGSIANLIVVVQAERCGVHITARAHLVVGLPITLASLAITAAAAWAGWLG